MPRRAEPFNQHTVARSKPQGKPYELRDGACRGLILRVEPTGTKSFYIVLRDGRRRKLEADPSHITLTQARDAAEAARGTGILPTRTQPAKAEGSKGPTLGDFLRDRHRPHFELHHDSTKHLDNYAVFEKSPPGPYTLTQYRLDELTPAVLDEWLAARLKPKTRRKGVRAASKAMARRNLGALKSALVQAVKWGVIPMSPLQHYSPIEQADNARTRYLTADEEARLVKALDEEDVRQGKKLAQETKWVKKRYKDDPAKLHRRLSGPKLSASWLKSLVLVALNTGARQGQLRRLEWRDVDFERRMLTLRAETSKSKRTNHVALNAEAIAALKLMPYGRADRCGVSRPPKQVLEQPERSLAQAAQCRRHSRLHFPLIET